MTVVGNSASQGNNTGSNGSHNHTKGSHSIGMNDRRGLAVRRGNSMQTLANLRSNGIAHASQQVTLTCYIPPNRVGAVIGRRGATILHIQREAVKQSRGNTSAVRVSVMGSHATIDHSHNLNAIENNTNSNSNSNTNNNDNEAGSTGSVDGWTPVVIRGDPCGAFAAAKLLVPLLSSSSDDTNLGDVMDDVVLDIPIHRSRHAAIIGRKGLTIATLSADHNVRIMVPHRTSVNEDTSNKQIHLVQLEGNLDHVQECCAHMLSIVCSNSNINNTNNSTNNNNLNNSNHNNNNNSIKTDATNESKINDSINKPKKMTDTAFTVPSNVNMSLARIKQIAKSTSTAIRRRKKNSNGHDASSKQQSSLMELTITGRSECVSKAVQQLERIVAIAAKSNDDTIEESNAETETNNTNENDNNETSKNHSTDDTKQHKTSVDGTPNRRSNSSLKRRNPRGGPGRGGNADNSDNNNNIINTRPKNNNPNKRGPRNNKRGGRGGDFTNNRIDSHPSNNSHVNKKTPVDSSSINNNITTN